MKNKVNIYESKELGSPRGEVTIYIEDNEIQISSLDIARNFNRRHDVVYNIITSIIENIPMSMETTARFYESMFKNKTGCSYPMYYMNKDAFWLLMSKLVVRNNLEWQIKYANAFRVAEGYIQKKHHRRTNTLCRLADKTENWFKKRT